MGENVKNKVVVTGLGVSTSIGKGVAENWQSMVEGKSNFKHSRRLCDKSIRTSFAAVDDRFEDQRNPRVIVEAYIKEVIEEASADAGGGALDRTILFSATSVYYWHERLNYQLASLLLARNALEEFSSEEGLSAYFFETYGLTQYPAVISTACASSATAIQLGYEAIVRGHAKKKTVAAADSPIYDETVTKFNNLSASSTRNDSPATACRPFSQTRDGFVMGEGGGCIVLEREDVAQKEGCPNLCVFLSGCGNTTDNVHRTKGDPSGRGIKECVLKAIDQAGLTPSAISCVNAHGTSTPENDRMEAKIMGELLGEKALVTSVKSLIGHTLNAAGVIEAVVSVLMKYDIVTPTLNYDGSLLADEISRLSVPVCTMPISIMLFRIRLVLVGRMYRSFLLALDDFCTVVFCHMSEVR